MSRVLITGSEGTVGQVLTPGLEDLGYEVIPFDLPHQDASNPCDVERIIKNTQPDNIIHLAWDTKTCNWKTPFPPKTARHYADEYHDAIDKKRLIAEIIYEKNRVPAETIHEIYDKNVLAAETVYRQALKHNIGVAAVSSVHANGYLSAEGPVGSLHPYDFPIPDNVYGVRKAIMEEMGWEFSWDEGLRVVIIRLGGVDGEDRPEAFWDSGTSTYCSHSDAINLFDLSLRALQEYKKAPGRHFNIINGISGNLGRIHDTTNVIGWVPKDGAKIYYKPPSPQATQKEAEPTPEVHDNFDIQKYLEKRNRAEEFAMVHISPDAYPSTLYQSPFVGKRCFIGIGPDQKIGDVYRRVYEVTKGTGRPSSVTFIPHDSESGPPDKMLEPSNVADEVVITRPPSPDHIGPLLQEASRLVGSSGMVVYYESPGYGETMFKDIDFFRYGLQLVCSAAHDTRISMRLEAIYRNKRANLEDPRHDYYFVRPLPGTSQWS